MLWQKSWWETRQILWISMGTVLFLAAIEQPWKQADMSQWISSLQERAPNWSEDTRRLLPLLSSHYGYVWSHWFKTILLILWPVYAVTMGVTMVAASCPWMAGAPGAAGLFTLSLPISRRRALFTHAALVAVEMGLMALAPSLMFPIVARLISGDVSFGRVVVHALLLSLGGMVFISLAFLMTAIFGSQWKVMAIGIAIALGLFFPFKRHSLEEFPWWHIYHLMSGETYFRYGKIPWPGLLASLAVSGLMMFAAARIYERRDF